MFSPGKTKEDDGIQPEEKFPPNNQILQSMGGEISQVYQENCGGDTGLIHSGYSDQTREGQSVEAHGLVQLG